MQMKNDNNVFDLSGRNELTGRIIWIKETETQVQEDQELLINS